MSFARFCPRLPRGACGFEREEVPSFALLSNKGGEQAPVVPFLMVEGKTRE